MPFIVSEKHGPYGVLVVVTDEDIIGRRFAEKRWQLDLTKEFYKGVKRSRGDVKRLMEKAQHLHLTGKESVALGIELEFVEPERVLYVRGIPHAEVVMS